jgi:molybdopterin-binding protein
VRSTGMLCVFTAIVVSCCLLSSSCAEEDRASAQEKLGGSARNLRGMSAGAWSDTKRIMEGAGNFAECADLIARVIIVAFVTRNITQPLRLITGASACARFANDVETVYRGATKEAAEIGKRYSLGGPMYGVNTMFIGCHREPSARAPEVQQFPQVTVHTFDSLVQNQDGTWYHVVDRKCWVRGDPGPIDTFLLPEDAQRRAIERRGP